MLVVFINTYNGEISGGVYLVAMFKAKKTNLKQIAQEC